MNKNILNIKNLKISFDTRNGEVEAVRGISFHVDKGEIVGIVGESGSGKSVTALSILRLLKSTGRVKDGEIQFKGKNILRYDDEALRKIRGKEISMIFQDPMTSLNPVFTVGYQIREIIRRHQKVGRSEAKKRAIEMLRMVEIPSPVERYDNYPHEFSGGMRQRALIAMALCCNPDLLIADEPTTALDVTIQAQIIKLIKDLNKRTNTSVIMITHDLGIVADICDRIIVMYGGLIMEEGKVEDIFYRPSHPYTRGLLKSLPKLTQSKDTKLVPIEGTPPSMINPPKGCPFAPRCPHAMDICREKLPNNFKVDDNHWSLCWLQDEDLDGEKRA